VSPAVLGTVAIGLLGAWLLGGLVLRLGGLVVALSGLAGLALSGDTKGILTFVIGGLLWLAGHWHYALRHQEFKSSLARYAFCRWAPTWLDPTRNWALAVAPEPADRDAEGERGRRG
jgi:hypothetical protein